MITDDLHFVPFGWPPESFPCEIPFMTHEYDGGIPFCWQIESVTCTGISGNTCKFSVRGRGIGDCKNAGQEERCIRFEPLTQQREPAGEAVTVTLPAVGENETFEVEIKILKNKLNEEIFTKFELKR
jgi:hypothetical protein